MKEYNHINTSMLDMIYDGKDEGPFSVMNLDNYIRIACKHENDLTNLCFGFETKEKHNTGYRYWVSLLEKDNQLGIVTLIIDGWPEKTGNISVWYKGSEKLLQSIKTDLAKDYLIGVKEDYKNQTKAANEQYKNTTKKLKEDLENKLKTSYEILGTQTKE